MVKNILFEFSFAFREVGMYSIKHSCKVSKTNCFQIILLSKRVGFNHNVICYLPHELHFYFFFFSLRVKFFSAREFISVWPSECHYNECSWLPPPFRSLFRVKDCKVSIGSSGIPKSICSVAVSTQKPQISTDCTGKKSQKQVCWPSRSAQSHSQVTTPFPMHSWTLSCLLSLPACLGNTMTVIRWPRKNHS